jgi:hypothetical protein
LVDFDLTSDGRFGASLHALSTDEQVDVLMAIDKVIAQHLAWDDFVAEHAWEPVIIHGEDTYPGAIELFTFALQGQTGQYYQLVASTINQTIVICTIVRRFAPGP